jgi:hypothetical protein
LPPKGTLFNVRRELPISVVLFPNQMNPRSFMPVEKLMEVLEKQSFILLFNINDT